MAINVGEKVFQFDKTDAASKNTFPFKIGNRNSNYDFENAISDGRKLDTSLITIQCCKDGTTQTEHMYMIRAARSCPCSMICQQKFSTIRGACRARELFKMFEDGVLSHDFLYRKASDNLVYEKGKASQSPSYIPVLERFRWRYVQPKH